MSEQAFTRLHNLNCPHPEPAAGDVVVNSIRQRLLDGEEPPLIVTHKPGGGFEVLKISREHYSAYVLEDFEHIPVIVISREN